MFYQKIEWKEEFQVGHHRIDSQHMELIRLYNLLVETSNEKVTISFLSNIINQLVHYFNYHFTLEEYLCKKNNSPNLEIHLKEHRNFIEKVMYFNENKQNEEPSELLEFLKNWIVHHICVTDKNTSDYFLL